MSSLFRKIFEKGSVHGFPYVVQPKFHWIERIFWIIMLILATYFSISICLSQWYRFRSNPIVYTVEKSFAHVKFPFIGVTMCSNYIDQKKNDEIVKRLWQISSDDGGKKYDYYMKFLGVLSALRSDNLEILQPYENDSTLDKISLLNITVDMRSTLATNLINIPLESNVEEERQLLTNDVYVTAVTEAGVCVTNSLLNEYTNPWGKRFYVNEMEICRPMDVCKFKVPVLPGDGSNVVAYFHHINDVADPFSGKTIKVDILENNTLNLDLELPLIIAQNEVRNLPITYRKCRYPDESNLNYFESYRPSFCRIECFIDAALKLCKCKPFFYAVARSEPMCDVKGLTCLARKNWTKTSCTCFPLCEEITYVRNEDVEHDYEQNKFERVALVSMRLPVMAMKRRVVFSTDQLIVSLGGAVSFFLGCSFLTFTEIFYFIIEYFLSCCVNRSRRT